MNGFVVFLLVVGAIALGIAGFVLATWMVVWNVSDIQAHGINFWNAFWLLVVLAAIGGGTGASSSTPASIRTPCWQVLVSNGAEGWLCVFCDRPAVDCQTIVPV